MKPPIDLPSITWRWCAFAELSVVELQNIYSARQRVFSLEQNCVYLDADGLDEFSHHLAAWAPAQREPLAYARLVAPGVKYVEPSVGRVITADIARQTGLGRELLRRIIAHCGQLYPRQRIRISAQSRLEAFYGEAGFVVAGEPYLEDGISHIEMVRAAPPPASGG